MYFLPHKHMSRSRHYQPLSVLFSVSAVALFSIVVAQQLTTTSLAATSQRYEENACSIGGLCGNGRKDTGEQCDWAQVCAGVTNGQGCDCKVNCTFCRAGESCAFVWPQVGTCSSSSETSSSSRNSSSKAVCGNGYVEGNEKCDDGNVQAGDGCNAKCKVESGFACTGTTCTSLCGNGTKDSSEKCDDGNRMNGDGCNSLCKVESGFTCSGRTCTPNPSCGNGLREGSEQCDLGAYNGPKGQSDCSKQCKINR